MLHLLALTSAVASPLASSKVLQLRGGMDLGPLNADNVGGFLKVRAQRAQDRPITSPPLSRALLGLTRAL